MLIEEVIAILLGAFLILSVRRLISLNRRRYRLITKNLSGIYYIQKRGKVSLLGGDFRELTGYKFKRGGKKIHDMVHPDDWARVNKTIKERLTEGGAWELEYRIVKEDKRVRWVNERGHSINKNSFESFIREITLKKKIEESLRESEEKYRNLVERANDGIAIVKDGLIVYLNSRLADMIGAPRAEIVKTRIETYISQEEREKFLVEYQKTIEQKRAMILETLLGGLYVEMSSSFINYEGSLADLLIIRDISQRRRIEEIIHQREQEFRNLVEHSPDIIARFDDSCRFLYVNPAIERDTGINPKSLFWKTHREAGFTEELSNLWRDAIETVFRDREERIIYTEQITLSGKKHYYTRILPEFDKKGEIKTVLAISRDITEAKEIDKVKSEFISISSHQLRTPLSIIRWCTIMFLDGILGEISEEQKGYLRRIYEATKKLIKISNTLLNAAILELGMLNVLFEEADIVDLFKGPIKEIERDMVEKKIKIKESYEKGLTINIDKRLFQTIIRALLSNAVKYSDEGGLIKIEAKRDGGNLLVGVIDDGRGIPQEAQSKIFTKFYRADNVKGEDFYGVGLDLYIIREIISSFGGMIWFESPVSKKKKGAAFYFTLPLDGVRRGLIEESL